MYFKEYKIILSFKLKLKGDYYILKMKKCYFLPVHIPMLGGPYKGNFFSTQNIPNCMDIRNINFKKNCF